MQWRFAEDAAAANGTTVDRKDWRVLMSFHLAETRDQARKEAVVGLQRWHNDYNVHVLGRPGAVHVSDPWVLIDQLAAGGGGTGSAIIGTPDDCIDQIRSLYEVTGGFGCLLGFIHDWVTPEQNHRSWDLFARYVVPEINKMTKNLRASAAFIHDNQKSLMASAGAAIMAKIAEDPLAVEQMKVTMAQRAAAAAAGQQSGFRPGAG